MSTRKRGASGTFHYDFLVRGTRYTGDTGCTKKREADRYEAALKGEVKSKPTSSKNLNVSDAIVKYWDEIGQYHKNRKTTAANLEYIENILGKQQLMCHINDGDVAAIIAKKRGTNVSPATVNRSVTEPMRAVWTRARKTWKIEVQDIDWPDHMLKEPKERVRELSQDEELKLFEALRPDFHPIVRFALLTGCRMQECLDLEWRNIDWNVGKFEVTGKGDKTRSIPLAGEVRALLWKLPRACDQVFTYVTHHKAHKPGTVLRMNREGLKTMMRRAIDRSGIVDFHFHDLRHTCATRLLRRTGNLRLVKELLGHSSIETTLRYAHVTDDDLRDALDGKAVRK